jgi:hypothetical protein
MWKGIETLLERPEDRPPVKVWDRASLDVRIERENRALAKPRLRPKRSTKKAG